MSFHRNGLLRGLGSAMKATGDRPPTPSSPLAPPATKESRRRGVEAVPVPTFSTTHGNGNWEQPPNPSRKLDHDAIKVRAPSHPSFAALLTTDQWSDRVLGLNRQVTLPHRVVWVVTGNNIRLAGDLGRRSLSIQIDPGVERPSLRTFDVGDLLEHVREEHPRLLVAALTVARGFYVAGCPGHGKPALGMFTAWDARIRAAVIWAHRLAGGEADPLDTQGRLVGEAPDREVLSALLTAWQAELTDATTTAGEAVKRASGSLALLDAIVGVGAEHGGKPDAKRLGYYLRKVAGRVVHGLVIEKHGLTGGSARWAVRQIGDPGPETARGDGGIGGIGRSASSYVYARGGRAAARANTDPTHATYHTYPTSDPAEVVEREAIREEAGSGLRGPTCPICAETDRFAGSAAGCRVCREFVAATGVGGGEAPASDPDGWTL